MKLTYDRARNIAYLRFHAKRGPVDTVRVSDELNVDLAPDGTVYGIELLNANVQIGSLDDSRLLVVNAAPRRRREPQLVLREKSRGYKVRNKTNA